MKLKLATKVEIKEATGKGLGVFATKLILKDEIIEECHLISLPPHTRKDRTDDLLINYRFNWPSTGKTEERVIPLGYGCIYNHSDNNNAKWIDHPNYKIFQFIAIKEILPGDEICTRYGGVDYWKLRSDIKLI